jgi:outer membrane immunogenic protein
MKTKLITIAAALAAPMFFPITAHAEAGASESGFHAGISLGWQRGMNREVPLGPTDTASSKRSSVTVRGYLGYDLPVGDAVVVGGEIGIANGGRDIETRLGNNRYTINPGASFDLVGRIGVKPTSGLLLFGKAGWGIQRVRTTQVIDNLPINSRRTEHGFLYGAGAQVRLSDSVSLRAEFDRVSFSDRYRRNRALAGIDLAF